MKPLQKQIFLTDNNQPLVKCIGKSSLSSRYSYRVTRSLATLRRTKRNVSKTLNNSKTLKPLSSVHAYLVGVVTNSKAITTSFPRFIIGLIFVVVLSPIADTFYTRFDFNARLSPDVWYYESWHWFFLSIGPYIKGIFSAIGLYLCLVHKRNVISISIVSYAIVFNVGKIIWLCQVTNHEEFKQLPSGLFLLTYGLATSVFLVLILDQLTFWLNHRVEAVKRRLKGLRLIADKVEPTVLAKSFCETMDYYEKVDGFQS